MKSAQSDHPPPPHRAFVPQTIVSWSGSKANIFEKQKVREIASLIRDTERHGKARIIDTSEGEEPEEMLKVKTNNAEHGLESNSVTSGSRLRF